MASSVAKDDYYKILGVPPTATPEAIKEAYKKLALKLHPDRNKAPDATAAFQLLGKGWDTLKDKDKRAAYDRECRQMREKIINEDVTLDAGPPRRKHREPKQTQTRQAKTEDRRVKYYQRQYKPSTGKRAPWKLMSTWGKAKPKDPTLSVKVILIRPVVRVSRPSRSVSPVDFMVYYEERIEDILDDLEELDMQDEEDENEIQNMGNREPSDIVFDLEEQFRVRDRQRRKLSKSLREICAEVRRLQEVEGLGGDWC